MDIVATARTIRMSPRKVRLVADLIRGKDAAWSATTLAFFRRKAARPVLKLLQSAVANAEHNFKLGRDRLYVKKITVDGGPTIKRFMPRAHGRAAPIRKRTSHITIVLDERAAATTPLKFRKRK